MIDKIGGTCSTNGREENFIFYFILFGKAEGKRPLGRLTRRWEDNIRMGVREIGWKPVKMIHLVQDKDQWRDILNTIMNLRVP
jgi:hypothetical protein